MGKWYSNLKPPSNLTLGDFPETEGYGAIQTGTGFNMAGYPVSQEAMSWLNNANAALGSTPVSTPEAKPIIPPTLKIPTAQEIEDILGGKTPGGKWSWLYDWMGSLGGNPILQQMAWPTVMEYQRGLQRAGMTSSSFADRKIRELADQFAPYKMLTGNNWLENVV